MASTISIPFRSRILENGLRVLFHEDRRLPLVHVALWYHVGSRNERPWRTGFAHLFEHLMFEGSRHNNAHFIRLMEESGASLSSGGVNGTTSHDRTNYYETLPREALGVALWAESDRMAYLLDVLDRTRLDTQREVVRNERFQRMDNVPYGTAWEKMFHALYPAGHPYSWDVIGDMGHLEQASLDEVHDFFRTFYVPNNAVLVIAGDFSERRALELVRKYFGSIPPGPCPGRPAVPDDRLPETRIIKVDEAVPHPRLYCGWSTVPFFHEDQPALEMLSDLLSDGINSRLYRRLVYQDRIASNVGAFQYSLEAGGVAGAVVTGRPEVPLARIRETMDEEIARFAEEGPTSEELAKVRAALQVGFVNAMERLAGKADLLARYQTFLGDAGKIGEHWVRYRAVTRADLRDACARYLLGPRVELLYGDSQAAGEAPAGQPESDAAWVDPPAVPPPPDPALAPEPDRTRAPRRGPRGIFVAPAPEELRLSNGLRLLVAPRRELPKLEGVLTMPGGRVDERRAEAGLASMTAEMMERGTETRSASRFESDADRIGAAIGCDSGSETVHLGFSCLGEHLRPTLDLLGDMLRNPAFRAGEMERLVPLRCDALRSARVRPDAILRRVVRRVVFTDGHPYGWRPGGDEASLEAMRPGHLRKFHEDRYPASDSAIVLCGDIEPEAARDVMEEYFGDWNPKGREGRCAAPPLPEARRGVFLHGSANPAPQAMVSWARQGPPANAPDRLALRLALHVLGGGFSSRLNLTLRERMGATYGAFARIHQHHGAGLIAASASVHLEKAGAAIRALLRELSDLASGKRRIRAREMEDARRAFLRSHVHRFETCGSIVGTITTQHDRGRPLSLLRRYPDLVAAVTAEEVVEAAARYLVPEAGALVVVGNAEPLESALEGLGPVIRVDPDGAPI